VAEYVQRRWVGTFDGPSRLARKPCQYQAYLPDPLADRQIGLTEDLAAAVSDAERAILQLNNLGPATVSLEALARLLLRAEAVASSKIEGLVIGPRRLVRAEAARESGEDPKDLQAEAILANIEAMRLAIDEVATKATIAAEDILAIHRALMAGSDHARFGGVIRTEQNWLGGNNYNPCGAAFVPPTPELVPALLNDLVDYLNTDRSSPLVQAAVAHAQFETIHPFADGNGRTGRALIHVVLKRRGLAERYVPPISLILATRSDRYINALAGTRYAGPPTSQDAESGMANWIDVFASATARACADAERFGAQIDALEVEWRKKVGPIRKNSSADLLLRVLPAAPIITVATAARLIGRSVPQTNEAIERFLEASILIQTKAKARNRVFEVAGLIEAITGFERALASPGGDTRNSPPVRPVPASLQR
jgi:Fic family protein